MDYKYKIRKKCINYYDIIYTKTDQYTEKSRHNA